MTNWKHVKISGLLALLFIAVFQQSAMGLGPHEIVLLVNKNSSNSVAIAEAWTKLREIPSQNIILLDIPESASKTPSTISRDDFTKHIWEPATRKIGEQGIGNHILAWVYSSDFPIRITTTPAISIQGITFLKNKLVDMTIVAEGRYASPLFTGPSASGQTGHYPQSLDTYIKWLQKDMPLPSMMLGYSQKGGNSREEILSCLKQGVKADNTRPDGNIYFAVNDDIRSKCRQWQFPAVVKELRSLGIKSEIVKEFPSNKKNILGLMTGAAWVRPSQDNQYLPGCMAEHLTSAAAIFEGGGQATLSRWIRAGTTASAGTVTEPFSIWTKFPHARFYSHYAAGCTMMESFFLSIRCPLQILLIGEPLSQPWAPRTEMFMKGLEEGKPVSGKLKIAIDVRTELLNSYARCMFLLDGKTIQYGRSNILEFDTSTVKNGSHVLRVVSYQTGLVRNQVFIEKKFIVNN